MGTSEVTRFDRWAPDYETSDLQRLVFTPAHEAVLRRCAQVVPVPRRVLDLGCGTGRLLRVAASRFPGALLVGVDISAGMLSVASRAQTPAGLVRAAAESLPFPSGSFDLVIATLTLRHWVDRVAGLAESRRLLAPGGVLAIASVGLTDEGGRMRRWRRQPQLAGAVMADLEAAELVVLDQGSARGVGPFTDIAVLLAGARRPGKPGRQRRDRG
jgi:ubiquinone/menaquinone biosynthesis C-methylase UbiE